MTHTDALARHPFASRAMRDAVKVSQTLDPDPGRANADYVRDPDEHEYYVLGVGHALAHLLTWCQQLEHAVAFLSDFSYSERIRSQGIRRHHHLFYNVENYIV